MEEESLKEVSAVGGGDEAGWAQGTRQHVQSLTVLKCVQRGRSGGMNQMVRSVFEVATCTVWRDLRDINIDVGKVILN
jgi:hypothetical protein